MNTGNIKSKISLKKLIHDHTLEFLIILISIALAIRLPVFLTTNNIFNLLKNMAVQGVIAFGMTMVIVSGDLDLSVGTSVAMTTVLMAWTAKALDGAGIMSTDYGILIGMLISLAASILVGFINGFFIVICKIPPMIATLAMQNMIYGLIATLSNGFPVIAIPSWFSVLGSGKIFNMIPVPVVILFIVFLITYYLLSHTPFGRAAVAVGGNAESARLSGIDVVRTKFTSLIIIQLCCWVSGIMLAGQVMSGNAGFGSGYEMNAIASVVIGGASISGGVGNMKGTLLGILFLQILTNGMTLLNVSTYLQYVVRGALIVGAVMFSTLRNRKKN